MAGTLVISLDFELFWGVRDHATVAEYGQRLLGVREAIPAMLDAFRASGVRATWATVGFLFYETKRALLDAVPNRQPSYRNGALSPYPGLSRIGDDETSDPFHYGRSLIEMIRSTPGQEIGSHTFSHYYTLEAGQTLDAFRADLAAARDAGNALELDMKSLVFPRNQYGDEHVLAAAVAGMTSYRGNELSWFYRARRREEDSLLRRGARLLDAYANVSGHHTYKLEDLGRSPPFNIAASRFLRPWSPRLRALEELRLRRIERGMRYAAEHGEVFHLWWHPHNFGVHLQENMANLRRLLEHFERLRRSYAMRSLSMGDIADVLMNEAA